MNQADYPITTMCRLLGVSTSGYYAWVVRRPSTRDEANARLLETITGIHQQSRRTYGAPRITAELREDGLLVGKNRVARLMKVAGIEGVSRRRKTRTTVRGQDSRPGTDANFGANVEIKLDRPFRRYPPRILNRYGLPTKPYYRTSDVCKVLGISPDVLRYRFMTGKYREVERDGWGRIFRLQAIEELCSTPSGAKPLFWKQQSKQWRLE